MDAKFLAANWVSILGIVGLGILAIFNLIDRASTQKRTEVDKADDRLMGILQATVTELEKKVATQGTDLTNATSRLTSIEAENKIIKDIFQGRDETMQTFMKQGFAAMAQMPDMVKTIANTNENVSKLYDLLHQLILQMTVKPTIIENQPSKT